MGKQKGFTIIELLVVIAVIGFLASVILVSLNSARSKARDTRRLADMRQLQTALDAYYNQNNDTYPSPDGDGALCGSWDVSNFDGGGAGGLFITQLKNSGLISKVPADPINNAGCYNYSYRYYRYPAGDYGCDARRGAFYVLGVSLFEGTPPQSPGWSCPTRNWTTEFQWVVGRFER